MQKSPEDRQCSHHVASQLHLQKKKNSTHYITARDQKRECPSLTRSHIAYITLYLTTEAEWTFYSSGVLKNTSFKRLVHLICVIQKYNKGVNLLYHGDYNWICKLQWAASVEILRSKYRFSSVLETFPRPFPQNNVDFSLSKTGKLTDHRNYTTLNWGARGIRKLT